jgi:hypothetical protein
MYYLILVTNANLKSYYMRKILLLLILANAVGPVFSQSVSRLLGSSPFQDSLWFLDTVHYNVRRSLAPFPNSGGAFTGMNGIAKNPNSGTIYTINKQSAVSGRVLGKLNVLTGEVTIVGNLGDNFSSITFRGDSLLAVTGNGATVPETLYLIDTTDASKTLLTALGNGADGEVICYNPDDDMIYHWSGGGTVVFEKILPYSPYTVTGIPNASNTGEIFGAVYLGNGKFLTSNISSTFNIFDAAGDASPNFGANPEDLRGMVFITCPRLLTGESAFCTGDSITLGAIPNSLSYQWYRNGLPVVDEISMTLNVKQPGWYNCAINDACGKDTLQGILVKENAKPVVDITGPQAFCAGDSILLAGSSGGTSQWFLNKTAIPGAMADTLYVKEPGNYNMIKTNLNGCADSAALGLTVHKNELPMVEITGNTEACFDSTSVLTGTGGESYQWFMNGEPLEDATDSSYAATHSGVYNLLLTDANGCADSAAVGLQLVIAEPVDQSVTIDNGTISANNTLADAYAWYDCSTSELIAGETESTYTPGHAGSYYVKITMGSCVGISECSDIISGIPGNLQKQVNLYPNPAKNKVTLDIGQNHVLSVEIATLSGKILFKSNKIVQNQAFDLSEYQKGIYLMNIKTDKGKLTRKIVKD